ncbi:hypothetical protein JMJ77_0007649, partial [Colletotrichum scovillei]
LTKFDERRCHDGSGTSARADEPEQGTILRWDLRPVEQLRSWAVVDAHTWNNISSLSIPRSHDRPPMKPTSGQVSYPAYQLSGPGPATCRISSPLSISPQAKVCMTGCKCTEVA